jgi:hypothetical protein
MVTVQVVVDQLLAVLPLLLLVLVLLTLLPRWLLCG